MKKLLLMTLQVLAFSACTVTIPVQSNLSNQTLLLAENRNIKANYTLESEVPNGYITFTSVMKNGSESVYDQAYKYNGATAFSSMWESYVGSKFNSYAKDEMDIKVVMKKLELKQNNTTSLGMQALTGNAQMNVEALGEFYVNIRYHGKTYQKDIKVAVSDYNESQTGSIGGVTYTSNAVNPTQQKSALLENCLNRSIVEFENFLKSIIQAES